MEALTSLNKKRGSLKSRVTVFRKFLNEIADEIKKGEQPLDGEKAEEIWQRLDRHKEVISKFEDIQGAIEELTDDSEDAIKSREQFEAEYYAVIRLANQLIELGPTTKMFPPPNTQVPISNTSLGNDQPNVVLNSQANSAFQARVEQILRDGRNRVPGIRLPIIELPKFKGDLSEWLKFRDTYISLIHNNASISNMQKFHYLTAALEGSAAQAIDEYEYTEQNYEIVWDALKRRYNDSKLLIHNHIEAIFKLKPITADSAEQLNELVDSITKHTRALKKLEEPTEYWDSLLIYLTGTKLDVETTREWEKQRLSLTEKPKLEDLINALRARAILLQTVKIKKDTVKIKKFPQGKTSSLLASKANCTVCKGEHYIQNCDVFLKLSPRERTDKVKQLKLCSNCLRKGHFTKNCSFGTCRKCNGKHNSLLHFEREEASPLINTTSSTATMCSATSAKSIAEPSVVLATALVNVKGENKIEYKAKAFLDSCAQSNFVSEALCNKLKLKKIPINMQVVSLSQPGPQIKYKCEMEISSRNGKFKFKTVCLVSPKIVDDAMPSAPIDLKGMHIPSHIKLADPTFHIPENIDLLIGAQWFWNLLCIGQLRLSNNLILQKTRLGWIVGGPMNAPATKFVQCNLIKQAGLEQQLTKFWEIEEAPIIKALSQEEKSCEAHFTKSVRRDKNGRFIVNMPLRESPACLGDSRQQAERRLLNLERRLKRLPDLRKDYFAFLKEYELLGHMTEIDVSSPVEYSYYLPHHCVVRIESKTTKTRVVFDASAPTTSGKSLNDIQMAGPILQNELFSIVLRFRKHFYVIAADIKKMYRQILMEESQRPLQRILWRERTDEPIKTFELNTVTYGTKAGSFQAIRCLYQLGIECERDKPDIAKIIMNDFYVDDLLTGSQTEKGAISIAKQTEQVLAKGKFELRKWVSNSTSVLNKIHETSEIPNNVQILSDGQEKTLGISWNPQADVLVYMVSAPKNEKITKRQILSVVSKIFDPLGLLAPCIILAKILLQKLWLEGLSWDESLPLELHQNWIQFSEQLTELNSLQIVRGVFQKKYVSAQLHGFSDASKNAYGACLYIRSISMTGNVEIKLLCAKTRVAPLKTQTIPRLELCAAHLLAKLVTTVVSALDVKLESITLWCDSMIVLGWIHTQPNLLPVFESNRVARIQESTEKYSWRHVPTKENPADLLSRGVAPRELRQATLWWFGPSFLAKASEKWPKTPNIEPVVQQTKLVFLEETAEDSVIERLFIRYSRLAKIVRIFAYCLRFIHRLKTKETRIYQDAKIISANEYQNSLVELVKYSQRTAFKAEFKSLKLGVSIKKGKLASLTPFIDNHDVIRVGGRLSNSAFTQDKKQPMILDSNHIFTKRLFENMHTQLFHAGPLLLLASIREKFWPLRGRNLARKVVQACVPCFKAKPRALQTIMGNLPQPRVSPALPFSITGIDYAGPFLIKDKKGRGCKVNKCYLSLFVCFATKALHLELVSDLTKEAFIAALRRFVSRRGKPSQIYSDNGTNFVGSNNELKELGKFFVEECKDLGQTIEDLGIIWKFVPSYSPHFGGLWEAGVKAVKHHLKRVAGNALLTFEELYTFITQVEAILNSRPLTPLSSDPNDLNPLTPAHFLIGRTFISVADPSCTHIKESRLSNWQRIQQLQQNLWERWSKEYISELQQRTKWKVPFPSLEVNTLVLLKEDNLPPSKWRLGRVVEVHPGSDGVARVASIRTTTGSTRRAFTKLCPLPQDDLAAPV